MYEDFVLVDVSEGSYGIDDLDLDIVIDEGSIINKNVVLGPEQNFPNFSLKKQSQSLLNFTFTNYDTKT